MPTLEPQAEPDQDTTPPARQRPKGIACLECRGPNLVVTSRRRPVAGLRVRYLKCEACGARLKTEERVVSSRPADPLPDSVPTSAHHLD